MTTETTNAGETTQVADTGAAAADATTTTTTILGGAEGEAGKTAEGAEAGAKGAETGTDGEKPKEGEGDKPKSDEGDKPQGAPEKYEFTMPDGVELDAALMEKAEPVLRELNLTNDQANKLATLIAEHRVSEAQRSSDAYAQQVEDWGKSARDDKEFGGAAFETSVAQAQKAIGQFGTPELKTLLADGLGNHPELIRFCVRVGKAIGEDGGVEASRAATPKSAADTLYDHPTSQKR